MSLRRRSAVIGAAAALTLGLVATGVAALSAQAASNVVLYVSPTGSDRNPGTSASSPLKTPQLAVDRLGSAGGTVELAGGTYSRQRIVLSSRKDVTVRAAAGATPVLDGTGLTPKDGRSGMVEITDGSGITIRGLSVTGYRTGSIAKIPVGILVNGSGDGITLVSNHVYRLGNDNPTKGSFDINAHGIAVYGSNAAHAVRNLTIRGNEVDHLVLGASETIVVNGNVNGWTIDRNRVHDDNNIGIDAIGYEPTITGPARYTDVNRARNGTITGNVVSGISAEGNPAYYEDGAYCRCADGIYVDGGESIKISGNTVRTSDIGIEVAAENPKGKANDVTVDRNTVTGSAYVGVTVGGYATDRGEAYDVRITNNTLTDNNSLNDGSPELLLQYKVHETTITGNRITAGDRDDPVLVQRDAPTGTAAQNAGVTLDCNDYGSTLSPADARFVWLGKPVTGFAKWKATTGQDASSTYTVRRT